MSARWLVLGLPAVTWPLGGCAMHGGMGGMHDGSLESPAPVEAAAETAALRVSLLVPAAWQDEGVTIVVRVRSAPLGEPVAGADVTVTVRAAGAEQAAAIRAEETAEGGVYQVSHRFAEPGPHEVSAAVRLGDLPAPAVAVTVQVVARNGRSGPGVATVAVVAGLAMVVMMAAMLARGTWF